MLTFILAFICLFILIKTDLLSVVGFLILAAIAALPIIAWIGVRL